MKKRRVLISIFLHFDVGQHGAKEYQEFECNELKYSCELCE